ncbi:bcl-2-like protein 11 isoform X2 [Pempheris klunzingeri]|uniref:bcl-2-like protein 11 isoform X2 n=1 Tax=Pempheris klunzingeri TaxID=3127111 RepID=UPI00398052E4
MHHPSRPPNRPDGSTAVRATQGSGGDPPPVGASGVSAQTTRSDKGGERSFVFHPPRRASSGYFSSDGDSLPTSPLSPRPMTADKATQTPSPTAQVMKHALQRMAEAHGEGPGAHQQHGHSPSPSSMRPRNAAGDMQTEAIGRELQRIGDDYNRSLLRGEAGRHGRVVILPNPQPHIHQELAMLLCCAVLLVFLIGRIIYSQSNTNNQDHSQETLGPACLYFDGDDSLKNSKMPGFLFFHLCFFFTVSEPLQCHQRAGTLHSFPAQRWSCHLYMPLCKITPVEIQTCLVQFPVYFF